MTWEERRQILFNQLVDLKVPEGNKLEMFAYLQHPQCDLEIAEIGLRALERGEFGQKPDRGLRIYVVALGGICIISTALWATLGSLLENKATFDQLMQSVPFLILTLFAFLSFGVMVSVGLKHHSTFALIFAIIMVGLGLYSLSQILSANYLAIGAAAMVVSCFITGLITPWGVRFDRP